MRISMWNQTGDFHKEKVWPHEESLWALRTLWLRNLRYFSSIVFHNSSFHLLTLSDHLQLPQQVVPVCQHRHGQSKFWHMRKNDQVWKLMRRIFVVVNVPFKVLLKYTEYDQPHESQTNSDILETIHRWEPKKYLFVSLCFFRKGLVGFL